MSTKRMVSSCWCRSSSASSRARSRMSSSSRFEGSFAIEGGAEFASTRAIIPRGLRPSGKRARVKWSGRALVARLVVLRGVLVVAHRAVDLLAQVAQGQAEVLEAAPGADADALADPGAAAAHRAPGVAELAADEIPAEAGRAPAELLAAVGVAAADVGAAELQVAAFAGRLRQLGLLLLGGLRLVRLLLLGGQGSGERHDRHERYCQPTESSHRSPWVPFSR